MWFWSADTVFFKALNWPWNGSPTSNCKDVRCVPKLTQLDLVLFLHLINIHRDYIWARDMVMWHCSAGFLFWQLSIDMDMQCHYADMNPYVYQAAWLRLPCLHDDIGDKSSLRAIPLAMLTMKKKCMGFITSICVFLLFLQDSRRLHSCSPLGQPSSAIKKFYCACSV